MKNLGSLSQYASFDNGSLLLTFPKEIAEELIEEETITLPFEHQENTNAQSYVFQIHFDDTTWKQPKEEETGSLRFFGRLQGAYHDLLSLLHSQKSFSLGFCKEKRCFSSKVTFFEKK